MAKQEVAEKPNNMIPAHLQGGKTAKFGNVDSTDLIIPRVKLLQAISPEVTDNDDAKAGQFWHTIAAESLGKELIAVPIIVRKTFVLWAPRGDDRGILARADDGLHWDNAGMSFTVKPKNSPHDVTYKLGQTVHDKPEGGGPALSEFGSSIPGDPKSPPAAALTYQLLWYFADFPELSPALILNTRSSVKPAQNLISKIDLRPVDHYGQKYKIGIVQEKGAEGPYFNYSYTAAGYASEEEYELAKAMYDKFSKERWRANDEDTENEDISSVGGRGGGAHSGPAESSKF